MASRSLEHVVPELAKRFRKLQEGFRKAYPGWKVVPVCTYRPPEEQFELFKRGRKQKKDGTWAIAEKDQVVTYKDGDIRQSKHNKWPAQAVDIEMFSPADHKYWDVESPVHDAEGTLVSNPWRWLRTHAEPYGLFNGANWENFKDYPHFELA